MSKVKNLYIVHIPSKPSRTFLTQTNAEEYAKVNNGVVCFARKSGGKFIDSGFKFED